MMRTLSIMVYSERKTQQHVVKFQSDLDTIRVMTERPLLEVGTKFEISGYDGVVEVEPGGYLKFETTRDDLQPAMSFVKLCVRWAKEYNDKLLRLYGVTAREVSQLLQESDGKVGRDFLGRFYLGVVSYPRGNSEKRTIIDKFF